MLTCQQIALRQHTSKAPLPHPRRLIGPLEHRLDQSAAHLQTRQPVATRAGIIASRTDLGFRIKSRD